MREEFWSSQKDMGLIPYLQSFMRLSLMVSEECVRDLNLFQKGSIKLRIA